jgi:hypothetical protein
MGALKVEGAIIEAAGVPLVTNNQDVTTTNKLIVNGASPNPINSIAEAVDGSTILLTFQSVNTILHLDPTVTGAPKLQVGGGVDVSVTPNSNMTFRYDASLGVWVELPELRHIIV